METIVHCAVLSQWLVTDELINSLISSLSSDFAGVEREVYCEIVVLCAAMSTVDSYRAALNLPLLELPSKASSQTQLSQISPLEFVKELKVEHSFGFMPSLNEKLQLPLDELRPEIQEHLKDQHFQPIHPFTHVLLFDLPDASALLNLLNELYMAAPTGGAWTHTGLARAQAEAVAVAVARAYECAF